MFPSFNGKVNVISNHQTDNPTGGVAAIAEYVNDSSVVGQGVAPNPTATNPAGQIDTPNVVYRDFWFNVTYTGNDYLGYANYDLKIDVSSLAPFNDPFTLYIVKRTDRTGKWVALNTTISGDTLIAAGLDNFSDFALAGDSLDNPLPVELSSFTSTVNRRDVNLNWTTATELNNSGFDVERSSAEGGVNGQWSMVGNVVGNGTTNTPHNYSFPDRGLASGNYNYRLKQIDFNGNFAYYNLSNEVNIGIPTKFDLSQNYPNPFNPSTKINYDIPFDGKVNLKIFDLSGREVATLVNEVQVAGYYTVSFNASNFASGVYFYRVSSRNFVSTKKMMLIK